MIHNTIKTSRLILRKMDKNDVNALFAIWSDPNVTKYMNIDGFSQIEQAEEMISILSDLSEKGEAIRYTILEAKTNSIIGSCGFNTLDFKNETAEVGYDLDSGFWNKGYGTEAVQGLVDYACHQLQFKKIEAKVDPNNIPSIKLLLKLDFILEGQFSNDLNLYTKYLLDDQRKFPIS
ncbi:ribosomal-protein-alanine N-acetyltransferase [Terribacillus halophilus]|uniref:Ribosomal-protein-alanine N-acetyltransferase n=1 Tax=Terribacillus halophilus TaxID=361279 RepID=A0A1G6PWW6_9BACI|nr:ribosomal-protein-alanine N-acetyltransferase [Terribacillus halophilus]